jgi:hypothetical protein
MTSRPEPLHEAPQKLEIVSGIDSPAEHANVLLVNERCRGIAHWISANSGRYVFTVIGVGCCACHFTESFR